MSADNYAKCPRCVKNAEVAFGNLKLQVDFAYGVVPVDVFDEMRANLKKERDEIDKENSFRTFREAWRIEGADDGMVKVWYCGECRVCKLKLEFTDKHPIPGL